MRLMSLLSFKRLAFSAGALALALPAVGATQTPAATQDLANQTPAEIIAEAESVHPAALYILATKLMGEGRMDEAVRWFYIGQLRYRFHLAADPSARINDQPLFSALNESVGRPINEYAFGDVDAAAAQIDAALEWDAAHPNRFTSKERHPEALAEVRASLQNLHDDMVARKDEIRQTRTRNGLPNR